MSRIRDIANLFSANTDAATDAEVTAAIAAHNTSANGHVKRGNTASRPANPSAGDVYANTQTGFIEIYSGSTYGWEQVGGIASTVTGVTATDTGSGRAYNNGSASVAFTPGTVVGRSYTVTSSPGSYTATGSSSPITVTGLQSSTQYTYTVIATNNYGTSAASAASAGVTATTVPQAPTIGTPTSGNAQASVAFTAGATGGSAITSYTVTSSPGNITASGASSPITVTGLTNGTAYTFTVTATNANGTSSASSASSSVTPTAFSGGNQSVNSIYDLANAMVSATAASPTSGGTLTVNGTSLGSYDYTIKSGNQTVSSFVNSDWFTTTEDTRSAFIAVNGNLTINSGQTFIPSNRKLFTCIYVNGTLTVNGNISMTARGSNHSGTGNSGGAVTAGNIRIINGTYSSVLNPQIPSSGGAGANGVTPGAVTNVGVGGATGTAGTSGGTGGGGSGASWQRNTSASTTSGNASAGTSFSGGSGTGGIGQDQTYPSPNTRVGENAGTNGGKGGDASAYEPAHGGGGDAGGGAGNPAGLGKTAEGGTVNQNKSSANGGTGTGGVLIIFCNQLAGSGTISANGVAGGNGSVLDGPGGGGSGGGSVTVMYQSDSSTATIQANGGSGGSSPNANGYNTYGGAGGAGTARKLALV